MEKRWEATRSQRLRRDNYLPRTTRSDAFAQCRLDRVNGGCRQDLFKRPFFRVVDKCAVRACDDDFHFRRSQLSDNTLQRFARLLSPKIIFAGMCHVDFNGSFASQQNRACAFARLSCDTHKCEIGRRSPIGSKV